MIGWMAPRPEPGRAAAVGTDSRTRAVPASPQVRTGLTPVQASPGCRLKRGAPISALVGERQGWDPPRAVAIVGVIQLGMATTRTGGAPLPEPWNVAFRGRVPVGRTLVVRQRPHRRCGDRSRFTSDGWSSRRLDGGRWIVEMLWLRERRVSWRSSSVAYGPASRAPPSGPVARALIARVAALARPVDRPRAHRRSLVRP